MTRDRWKLLFWLCSSAALALVLNVLGPVVGTVVLDALFGEMWMSGVMHAMIDAGLPERFVCGYVSFGLMKLPVWILVALCAFFLSWPAKPWCDVVPLSLGVWMPIADYFLSGLMRLAIPEMGSLRLLLCFNILIPSLLSIPVAAVGWLLGSRLRRGRSPEREHPPPSQDFPEDTQEGGQKVEKR